MKKGIKLIGMILAIIIASMLIIGRTYAMDFKFKVTSDKTEAKAGEEVVISLEIVDINMGELRNKYNRRNTRV